MRNKWIKLSLTAASMVFVAGATARADDEAKLAKAPTAVQAVVKKTLGTAGQLEGCDVEEADGKPAYDIDMKIDGTSYAMLVSADGTVLEREVEITLAMAPPAVLQVAAKAQPTGKTAEVSIITRGDQVFYEVEVKVGKDLHDIEVTAGGKLLADHVAKPEAPDATEKPESATEKKD